MHQKHVSLGRLGCHTRMLLRYSKFGITGMCVYRHTSDTLSTLLTFWYVWILFCMCCDGLLSSKMLPPGGLPNKHFFMQHNRVNRKWEAEKCWYSLRVDMCGIYGKQCKAGTGLSPKYFGFTLSVHHCPIVIHPSPVVYNFSNW
jgi:hypothetical protein